ncbi:MAG: RNA methyltransferase [Anaerolineae bacterium]|nr:RNA methyltransferase [Anaerolineae bacterium]
MITSTKNPRLIEARKLAERKHRRQQNRFLVEGLQLLSLAVEVMDTPQGRKRINPLELFYSEDLFTGETAPRLLAQLTQAGAEAIPVAPHVLDTLSERDVSQGLAATFALNNLEYSLDELVQTTSSNLPPPHLLASSPPRLLLLLLDKLQDPGNLGTLIRTADAVGVRGVILLEPCVDPFDPKTVRGTMGSLFTVPFARTKDAAGTLTRLAEQGFRLVGADGRQGELPWQSEVLVGPVALVLGNEARGLSPELRPHLHGYVRLPLRGHAESLNVSVAGGTLMYEWLRVNSDAMRR